MLAPWVLSFPFCLFIYF
uniref:Uncharacterized protein n=1 Tax=Rhizophora mucronata TaxID=61149 RepID=A0A2P2QVV8_RHIMU